MSWVNVKNNGNIVGYGEGVFGEGSFGEEIIEETFHVSENNSSNFVPIKNNSDIVGFGEGIYGAGSFGEESTEIQRWNELQNGTSTFNTVQNYPAFVEEIT